MDFDSWAGTFPGSAEGVAKISRELGSGGSPADVFRDLCAYSRDHFVYFTNDTGGLSSALGSGTMSCRSASDLVIGVVLHRTGLSLDVQPFGVHDGYTPVVTPPITQPGIQIQNNLRGGGDRMLFTGGHSVASIGGTLYDLVSGLSGGSLDFLAATKKDDKTFECEVDGTLRTFTGIGGTTGNGLAEFKVDPPLG
jgi:hypothetical protein